MKEARPGADVITDAQIKGEVCSIGKSPSLPRNIYMIYFLYKDAIKASVGTSRRTQAFVIVPFHLLHLEYR